VSYDCSTEYTRRPWRRRSPTDEHYYLLKPSLMLGEGESMTRKTVTRSAPAAAPKHTQRSGKPGKTTESLPGWEEIEEELVREARDSGRLTEHDYAIRINARG
jgi:hypothetical protein